MQSNIIKCCFTNTALLSYIFLVVVWTSEQTISISNTLQERPDACRQRLRMTPYWSHCTYYHRAKQEKTTRPCLNPPNEFKFNTNRGIFVLILSSAISNLIIWHKKMGLATTFFRKKIKITKHAENVFPIRGNILCIRIPWCNRHFLVNKQHVVGASLFKPHSPLHLYTQMNKW